MLPPLVNEPILPNAIPLPESTLAYERYLIGTAIRSITSLLDKQPKPAKSRKYYEVMAITMTAIEQVMQRLDAIEDRLYQQTDTALPWHVLPGCSNQEPPRFGSPDKEQLAEQSGIANTKPAR